MDNRASTILCSIAAVLMATITVPVRAQAKGKAPANPTALQAAMEDIEWGWSPKQVFEHYRKKIEEGANRRIAKATDAIEEDYIREQMRAEISKIRDGYFEFDGRPTGFDSGFLRGEFTHNNSESMLHVRSKNANDYYFFIKNRLWKRYRAFNAEVFDGASFEEFGKALQGRYGKAKVVRGSPAPGEEETQWYAWKQRGVLARAVDHTRFYGFYCLALEDPSTVKQLAKLRTHQDNAAKDTGSVVDLVVGSDEDDDMHADIADRITGEIRRRPGADDDE